MSYQETITAIERSKLDAGDKARVVALLQLLTKSSADMTAFELNAARIAAGLSPGQAVRLLELKREELLDMEAGGWDGSDKDDPLVKAFDRVYGLDPEGR